MRKFLAGATAFFGIYCLQSPVYAEDLIDLYKYLHANPELSNVEYKTSAFLANKLEVLGFDVTEKVGGTGVVAVMENGPGKTVMIRADMDALPVREQTGLSYASTVITKDHEGNEVPAMHACGHDIHMTVLIGTAKKLVASKASWSGTLIMILQPAEELGKGARAMLEDGLFERFPRPDYNLALHNNTAMASGTVGMVPGWALANVDSVDITVRGVGGHGAYPHTARDPVVLSAQIINALQTIVSREISPLEPAVVTVGSIHGGTKHNIIPDEVKLQLTIRSYTKEVRQKTIDAIKRIAENQAQTMGIPEDSLPIVKIRDEHTPATYNNPELVNRMMGVIGKAIGEENVSEVSQVMGGEDFGQYGQVEPKIPSLIFWLGAVKPEVLEDAKKNGKTLPSLHSPFWAPDAKPTLETGIKAMTTAALDLFKAVEQ